MEHVVHTCSSREAHVLSSLPFWTRRKNISRRRCVAASRVCTTGLGLYARCGGDVFFSFWSGEAMAKANECGTAFADRSESGDGRGGVCI